MGAGEISAYDRTDAERRSGRSGITFRYFRRGCLVVCRHPRTNLGQGRKYPKERESTGIHNHGVVDTDLKRAVWPRLECHVDTEFPPQHGRRPGGLHGGDSVDTALYRDLRHGIRMEAGHGGRPQTRTLNSGPVRLGPQEALLESAARFSHSSLEGMSRGVAKRRYGAIGLGDGTPMATHLLWLVLVGGRSSRARRC